MQSEVEVFDCRSCGACCSFRWSWPVLRRDRSDATGIPPEMLRKDFPLMKTVGDRCVGLKGKVGKGVSCKVYEDRPTACQRFEPGSKLCKEARGKHGIGGVSSVRGCVFCRSGRLYPERGPKGGHWWVCDSCGAE